MKREFSASYDAFRHIIWVYDDKGDYIFYLDREEVPPDVASMSEEELCNYIEEHHGELLDDILNN